MIGKHNAARQLADCRSEEDLGSLAIAWLTTVDHILAHELEVGLGSSHCSLLTPALHTILLLTNRLLHA